MNNEPLVTVAIPTFNRCNMLKKCLDTVINQTYKNLEIIVSDNHSTDDTKKMMKEYTGRDSRIKYYRHGKNMGMDFQGNFIINAANGVYWSGVCDDDWIDENYIEECMNILQNNNDIDFTYGTVKIYDENYSLIKTCKTCVFDQDDYSERMCSYMHSGIDNAVASVFMRTDKIKSASEYNGHRFCEDQIILLKYLFNGKGICSNQTYYHKLNNGCTKNLKTLKKTYNMPRMTQYNFWKYLSRCHCDAILNDDFYIKRLSLKERKLLAKKIAKEIEAAFKPPSNLKNILQYMWRHPLFILRKDFYKLLKTEFSL